ncbi:MAG: nucleotidyl transferase AbiEii/AbiGii toxin family protein [Anaerolineaceae bacterium]
MRYQNGSAFRRALEERLNNIHAQSGTPILRLRKLIAFDRFIARLMTIDPDCWVLKGGLLVQIYMGEQSRTTKDIDFLSMHKSNDLHKILIQAGNTILNDWFSYEVSRPSIDQSDSLGGIRFNVIAFLDTRVFEQFHLDVNTSDKLVQPVDVLSLPNLLEFAELSTTRVRCYSITQQIAEKIHSLTREYRSGGVSRVKDFIDILLLAGTRRINMLEFRHAIQITFKTRNTHEVPTSTPQIDKAFFKNYTKLAKEVNLLQQTPMEGNKAIDRFLSPALSSKSYSYWEPKSWSWHQ